MRFVRGITFAAVCALAAPLAAQQYTIDFEALAPGSIVSSVDAVGGGGSVGPILVDGSKPSLPGENVAIIFDSSNPPGLDFDLGSPNETFPGGVGVGEGGEAGQPHENDTALGHILIIAENLDGAEGDDIVDVPNDADERDMVLTLDFSGLADPAFAGEATVISFTAIDIQQAENELPSTAEFYGAGNMLLGSIQIGDLGNNGVETFAAGFTGVQRIEFLLNGSGGIDNVVIEGFEEAGCRVTGGGVDGDNQWDGTLVDGECGETNTTNRYTFGGQAGAPTGAQPQPYGEWTHRQHSGPAGRFTFHGGTASAIDGTEISLIECGDPGFCNPARPAPAKQIRFEGVGYFTNIGNNTTIGTAVAGVTLHFFTVRINDAGEPGGTGGPPGQSDIPDSCPNDGFDVFEDPNSLVDCECPDFYRISIYDTPTPGPGDEPIYTVCGYGFGGNLQIHPSLD